MELLFYGDSGPYIWSAFHRRLSREWIERKPNDVDRSFDSEHQSRSDVTTLPPVALLPVKLTISSDWLVRTPPNIVLSVLLLSTVDQLLLCLCLRHQGAQSNTFTLLPLNSIRPQYNTCSFRRRQIFCNRFVSGVHYF